ncbi:MAG: hypothetical protein ACOZQL_23115 [Myxococcota bacterium]
MSTRAQDFRNEQQRQRHLAPKAVKPRRVVDPLHTDTRNVTKRGDKKVGMALEDSMSGRPSRVSSRPSSHHGRSDTELMKTARMKSMSPKARASRAKVARKK